MAGPPCVRVQCSGSDMGVQGAKPSCRGPGGVPPGTKNLSFPLGGGGTNREVALMSEHVPLCLCATGKGRWSGRRRRSRAVRRHSSYHRRKPLRRCTGSPGTPQAQPYPVPEEILALRIHRMCRNASNASLLVFVESALDTGTRIVHLAAWTKSLGTRTRELKAGPRALAPLREAARRTVGLSPLPDNPLGLTDQCIRVDASAPRHPVRLAQPPP